MQPKHKLRLLSLAFLVPFFSGLFYFLVTKRSPRGIPILVSVGGVYLASMWTYTMVYMIRHREELRDPPEERERRRQWALKNGRTSLNLVLVLYALSMIGSAFLLRRGHLDAARATLLTISLVVSLPGMVFLLWVKRRLRLKAAIDDRRRGARHCPPPTV